MHVKSILLAVTASLLATAAYAAPVFNRVASFPVEFNNPEAKATSSEIISASEDGMTLVYSDSPAGGIGFIDPKARPERRRSRRLARHAPRAGRRQSQLSAADLRSRPRRQADWLGRHLRRRG